MIRYRCPFCNERVEVAEQEIDLEHECVACGARSHCPGDAYHKERLRRLKAHLSQRPLLAAELREAAVHYRGLGQDDKARRAEKAARRAAESTLGEDIPAELLLAAAVADLHEPESSPYDLPLLAGGAAVWLVVVAVAALLHDLSWQPLLLHGMAALGVAAGCAARGAPIGWTWLAALAGGAPLGLIVGLRTAGTAPRHLPITDLGLAVVLASLATAAWIGEAAHLLVGSLT